MHRVVSLGPSRNSGAAALISPGCHGSTLGCCSRSVENCSVFDCHGYSSFSADCFPNVCQIVMGETLESCENTSVSVMIVCSWWAPRADVLGTPIIAEQHSDAQVSLEAL